MTTSNEELEAEFARVLNTRSRENMSGTPDFILARYLVACLRTWEENTMRRDEWWKFDPKIGSSVPAVDECPYCEHATAVHDFSRGGCLKIVGGDRCPCGGTGEPK